MKSHTRNGGRFHCYLWRDKTATASESRIRAERKAIPRYMKMETILFTAGYEWIVCAAIKYVEPHPFVRASG